LKGQRNTIIKKRLDLTWKKQKNDEISKKKKTIAKTI
jgi:hypothetical protein